MLFTFLYCIPLALQIVLPTVFALGASARCNQSRQSPENLYVVSFKGSCLPRAVNSLALSVHTCHQCMYYRTLSPATKPTGPPGFPTLPRLAPTSAVAPPPTASLQHQPQQVSHHFRVSLQLRQFQPIRFRGCPLPHQYHQSSHHFHQSSHHFHQQSHINIAPVTLDVAAAVPKPPRRKLPPQTPPPRTLLPTLRRSTSTSPVLVTAASP